MLDRIMDASREYGVGKEKQFNANLSVRWASPRIDCQPREDPVTHQRMQCNGCKPLSSLQTV
ncbi:MAG: hypothetical protein VYA84_01625, partial [Planctomycetota bacterium]|nr:hypothetical protein [Planctomycetota bacterium]